MNELLRPFTPEPSKPASPEVSAKLTSIDDYFSIENEIDFVDQVKGTIPMEDTRKYVEDDMYKFLGEFAGKVPYTTIRYKKTPEGLNFAGLNLSNSYKNAAMHGEREHAEWVGYDKIQQGMIDGTKTAKWISPAKISNYGFLFYFQQEPEDPEWITEYILRYNEPLGTTGESQKILDRLSPDQSYNTAEDFLNNPVMENGFDDPRRELMYVLNAAGVSQVDIERSLVYETTVRQLLSKRIDEYTDAILTRDTQKATRLRNGIFAAAVEIAGNLQKQVKGEPGYAVQQSARLATSSLFVSKFDDDALFSQYTRRDQKIEGGGSCPAIKKASSNPFSASSVLEALKNGTTPEKMAQKEWDYDIPGTCRTCDEEYTEEQARNNHALGPCMLCEDCTAEINMAGELPESFQETPLPR